MDIAVAGIAGLGVGIGLVVGVLLSRRIIRWLERDESSE